MDRDFEKANQDLRADEPDYLQSKAGLSLRKYQLNAIRAVENHLIENPDSRRALLAMATGTGKTRTIIGLCYRLIKHDRFKRILFLVDRRLLAVQALNAFEDNKIEKQNTFSAAYHIKTLKDNIPDVETRLQFATVQSMVTRLFINTDDEPPIPVDTYDCIIVDEAHRGYLLDKEAEESDLSFKDQDDFVSKYSKVLDYFDAFAIGLTATPALHTREIFGKAIFTYSYKEAVIDGFLVDHEPPYLIKTKLSDEGITWEKGEKPKVYDSETNKIVELESLKDELTLEVESFNKLVLTENFNRTVVSHLVQVLDPDGDEKTLVFAVKDSHADEIVRYFEEEFEKIGIDVAVNSILKITGRVDKPQELLKRFKNEKYPNIVVTVDLLTTGIDVPSITNLVFMRRVKSRILYEQMLGRATRICDEIGKEYFRIYDAVRIYEALEDFTHMKPVTASPKSNFSQLVEELKNIHDREKVQKQIEQLVAKMRARTRKMSGSREDKFRYLADGHDPDSFIQLLQDQPVEESATTIMKLTALWKYLDEFKPKPDVQLFSDHDDEYITTERGYGEHEQPDDYLKGFEDYIRQNQNKLLALKMICTRPADLTRKALKELLLELDANGYNTQTLRTAWKNAKNEDIATDIIAYIRTLALGDPLVSHEVRIKQAIGKIKNSRNWNIAQVRWLDRFEKQLVQESVLQVEDLDRTPFKEKGGFNRLNKIFGENLLPLIRDLNEYMYTDSAS